MNEVIKTAAFKPLDPAKFRDPNITAKGERRAPGRTWKAANDTARCYYAAAEPATDATTMRPPADWQAQGDSG